MMHYRKGENVEEEIKKEELPFEDCFPDGQKDFLWMHVKGGTKVNNVVTYAKSALEKGEYRTIVWTGSGGGLVKTVSCAEIIKRSHPLYQVTRMNYTNIDEHWLPQMEGLDEIVVKRKIPSIHILMSLDEIDESVTGLQKPNAPLKFSKGANPSVSSNRHGRRFHGHSGGTNQQSNQNSNQQGTGNREQRSTKYSKHQRDKNNKREQAKPQNNRPQNGNHKNQASCSEHEVPHSSDKTAKSKSFEKSSPTSEDMVVKSP